MASDKQIAANRINAQKSTGPRFAFALRPELEEEPIEEIPNEPNFTPNPKQINQIPCRQPTQFRVGQTPWSARVPLDPLLQHRMLLFRMFLSPACRESAMIALPRQPPWRIYHSRIRLEGNRCEHDSYS